MIELISHNLCLKFSNPNLLTVGFMFASAFLILYRSPPTMKKIVNVVIGRVVFWRLPFLSLLPSARLRVWFHHSKIASDWGDGWTCFSNLRLFFLDTH